MLKKVIIYTDGACSSNPGPGGWGAVLIYGEHRRELSGFCPLTTNQKMELTAALMALKALKEPCRAELYSDSAYLINAFTKGWTENWQKNGWLNSQKKPVENKEIWQELCLMNKKHQITWLKIKGHNGDTENECCDGLARKAIADNTK